jgi:hypothetical protein
MKTPKIALTVATFGLIAMSLQGCGKPILAETNKCPDGSRPLEGPTHTYCNTVIPEDQRGEVMAKDGTKISK